MIKYETFIARNFPDLCTVYMKSYSKLTFGTTFGLTFGLTLEMKSVLELEQQSVALQHTNYCIVYYESFQDRTRENFLIWSCMKIMAKKPLTLLVHSDCLL